MSVASEMCCCNSTAKSLEEEEEEEDHDQYCRCSLQRSKLGPQMVEDDDFPNNIKRIDLEGENGNESQQHKKKRKKTTTTYCSRGSDGCEGLQQRMRILHSLVHSNNSSSSSSPSSSSSSSSSCLTCRCSKSSSCLLNADDEEYILDETISYLKQLQSQVGFVSNCYNNNMYYLKQLQSQAGFISNCYNNMYYLNMTTMIDSSMLQLQLQQQQQQQLLPTTTTHADFIDKKSNKKDFTLPQT